MDCPIVEKELEEMGLSEAIFLEGIRKSNYEKAKSYYSTSKFSNYKPFNSSKITGIDVFIRRVRRGGNTISYIAVLKQSGKLIESNEPFYAITPKLSLVDLEVKRLLSITEES